MTIESILRKAKKALREMNSQDQKALGALAGIIAGEIANKAYWSQTPEVRQQWERTRLMHHGDAGYMLKEFKKKDPFCQGLGEGLMISDLQDKDRCVYPKIEQVKRRKRERT